MPASTSTSSQPYNLMDLPGVGRFLRWRHARTALQVPLLVVAVLMIFDGLVGPQMAPKNLATVLTWVHYRGLVVVALLLAGNLFCMACPFMLVRNVVRRLHAPTRMWPRRLRGKWLAAFLFVLMLFAYEYLDLWAEPRWTAGLILAYFAGAMLVDSLFRGATFCKMLCPLGQFNFVSSLISPLEVRTRLQQPCADCRSKDCIRGQAVHGSTEQGAPAPALERSRRGCELWLFQPQKFGNMDCTFCLDCAHVCPPGNVGISARLPGSELWADPWRSGVGRFSRRPDLAALVVVFTFGALLNAFAMITPVYALEDWLAGLLHVRSELPVLAIIFFAALVLLPASLLGITAWLARRGLGASQVPLMTMMSRYAFALVPLGFAVWLAHYAFHFLTGFWTIVPVVQSFAADLLGLALLGMPRWDLGALLPPGWLYPLELGFLGLGWFGSLLVTSRLASKDEPARPWPVFLPWALMLTLIFLGAIWLMGQPMEMRGTFLAG